MIYEATPPTDPIRQGDIFIGLPRIEISLQQMVLVEEEADLRIVEWRQLVNLESPPRIIVPVRAVSAIVATQDCDASRGRDITLCEIGNFREVYDACKDVQSPKSWVKVITQHSRLNLKWFYLPPDPRLNFTEKMAADFQLTIRVPREDLENYRYLRRGRLNDVAYEHFRERISEFFRRYPYDEWYPLDSIEMAEYVKDHNDAKPYDWQQ